MMKKFMEVREDIVVKNAEGAPDTKATVIHRNSIDYEPKVSVIIPVYNTAEYLRTCLDSVINQTLKEIEIICVDDGSTDSSLEILKEYAQKDNRFTIVTQKNLHAGVARNAGLAIARGEYLSFLDSDDWFELNMLEEMVTNIEIEKSEIICCQYRNFNVTTNTFEENRGINQTFEKNSIISFKKNNYTNNLYTISNPMPWNKLFSTKFIKENNIYFQSLISSNDIYFSMLSLSLCDKFTLILKPLVNYRYNRQSSLKNSRDKHPLSFYYAYKGLYKTLHEYKYIPKLKYSFYKAFVSTCLWTLNNTVQKRNFVKNFIKEDIVSEFSLLKDNKKYIPKDLYNKLISLFNPDLIISLTSFPARINTVHLVIESLLNQTIRADKIILWLAPEQFPNKEKDLPQELLNLQKKGLIIDWYHDIRSYKKLIPTLKKYPESIIVTADDDNIYSSQWLEKLYNSYLKYPKDIQAHRITKFFYKHGYEIITGGYDYYKRPSYLNKLVGLGGVLYPPNCFYKDILNEELFMKLAPTNDDQWFWLQAVLNGTKIRVVEKPEIKANYVEGTQDVGLTNINDKGANLFWKDFHRLLEYYPQLKNILLKEANKMKNKNNGTIDKYKKDLEIWYKRIAKKDLDLENPQTLNEKIQWLKLYDSTPIKTRLADKYLVRDWIKEKIGEEYLIPLLGVYDSFDEIDFDKLPNRFVLKCNHGSGYNIIVKDKSIFNKEEARIKINKWMQENFAYRFGVELHYKNITPKIIIEKYLETEDNDLQDYKFLCFNGKIEYIWVDQGRYTDHKRNLYNLNWELQKEKISEKKEYENFPHKQPPTNLGKMIKFAEKLSEGFCFVRVDFYEHENQLYFGEMTFTSSSGTHIFTPDKFGLKLGKLIKLPQLAYNIETGEYYKLPKYKKCKLKKFLQNIFSIKNINLHKVITILGVKFKLKNKKLIQREQMKKFEQKINTQNTLLQEQKKLHENTLIQIDELKKIIKTYKTELNEQNNMSSNYEIQRCADLINEIKNIDFKEKYQNLIRNLDENSIDCISKILSRIQIVGNSGKKSFDIFNDTEIVQINKLKKDFNQNKIKINENCYAYKQYLLPINHFEASVFYYKHDIENLKNIKSLKNKDIIDVGAFIGDSAIVLTEYTDKKIWSFEPTSKNYEYLLQTIELNNKSDKIIPVKTALGANIDEEIDIYIQGSGSSIDRVIMENPDKETINSTTLDDFVKKNNIQAGLIKVDIEGFEQEFLKGAMNTIKTQKPTLLLSIYHNASDFFEIKPIIENLNLGYSLKIVKPIDGGIRGETLLIAEQI